MPDLEAVEARIWSLLEPYRGELESATIHGMPSLRWPGAKAHDYFAAIKAGKNFVSLYLLVANTYPKALAATPDSLLRRRTGKPPLPSRVSTMTWRATLGTYWRACTRAIGPITPRP